VYSNQRIFLLCNRTTSKNHQLQRPTSAGF